MKALQLVWHMVQVADAALHTDVRMLMAITGSVHVLPIESLPLLHSAPCSPAI